MRLKLKFTSLHIRELDVVTVTFLNCYRSQWPLSKKPDCFLTVLIYFAYLTTYFLQRVKITADRSYSARSENVSRVSKNFARGTAPYVSITFFSSNREPSYGSSSLSKLPSTRSNSSRLPFALSDLSGLSFTISSSSAQPSEPCCRRGLPPTSCSSSGLSTGSGAKPSSSDDLLRHET